MTYREWLFHSSFFCRCWCLSVVVMGRSHKSLLNAPRIPSPRLRMRSLDLESTCPITCWRSILMASSGELLVLFLITICASILPLLCSTMPLRQMHVFTIDWQCFEGMKAYRDSEGHVRMFRPRENVLRLNSSIERLCLPVMKGVKCNEQPLDPEVHLEAIKELVRVDKDWIPTGKGYSLYIRPTCIATDAFLGVHPSKTCKVYTICSPSGPYYATGFKPIKLVAERIMSVLGLVVMELISQVLTMLLQFSLLISGSRRDIVSCWVWVRMVSLWKEVQ